MANEIRVRADFVEGLVDDNPLTAAATTLTSTELANLPAIGATEHAVIVIDPDGTPEIVYVTAHTAGATTATIARGKEGTAAVEHAIDTPWVHAPVVSDYDTTTHWAIVTNSTVTDNPTPVANTLVNGMSVTVPASDHDRLALVSAVAFFDASHPNRFYIYLDSAKAFPIYAGNPGMPSVDDGSSSSARWICYSNVPVVIPGDGATHTIALYYNASDSTAATTFNDRYISVVLSPDGASVSPGWL